MTDFPGLYRRAHCNHKDPNSKNVGKSEEKIMQ